MKVEWMMFANHAEDTGGLLTMTGATWDTINVHRPTVLMGEPPPGVALPVAAINGSLVIRLLFHMTETNREHRFSLRLIAVDGQEVNRLDGNFTPMWSEDNPAEWDQGVNIIVGLAGMPLPDFGQYTFHLLVDDNHVGERPFRVIKRY